LHHSFLSGLDDVYARSQPDQDDNDEEDDVKGSPSPRKPLEEPV
jgi:hypothetical protein